MTPQGINYSDAYEDDELVPLPKIPPANEEDLVPLPKLPKPPLDELVPLDKNLLLSSADKKALAQAKISRLNLNKKLKRDCVALGVGELEIIPPEVLIGEGELTIDESMIYNEKTGKWEKREETFVIGFGELTFLETTEPAKPTPSMLQTVISNGMEILKSTAKHLVNLFK